jgi:predicted aminopeptidase
LQRWLKLGGHEDELQRYKSRRERQQQFIALFTRARSRLATLYAQHLPANDMRERKKAIFASLDGDLSDLAKRLNVRSPYREWSAEGLNNAHLASLATYYDCLPGFERLLSQQGGNLPSFYAAVRELSRKPRADRHAELCRPPPPPATRPSAEPPSAEHPSVDQPDDRR